MTLNLRAYGDRSSQALNLAPLGQAALISAGDCETQPLWLTIPLPIPDACALLALSETAEAALSLAPEALAPLAAAAAAAAALRLAGAAAAGLDVKPPGTAILNAQRCDE
jgi:hypothetical protein